jgi:hypothetical protein
MPPLVEDDFWAPIGAPEEPYMPSAEVVVYCVMENKCAVAEVAARLDGTYCYSFSVWVAWRDAGGEVRSQSWYRLQPKEGALLDRIEDAQALAAGFATGKGEVLSGAWRAAR